MKLLWSKLVSVTMDGSLNLTGKNVGLLNFHDKTPDTDPLAEEKEINNVVPVKLNVSYSTV